MSFLTLLTTGKSLIGMKDAHSPYRMRTENLLPKFESTKNPFAAPAKIEPVISEPVATAIAAAPQIAKVAPTETYPLFDVELKPAFVVKEPQPARGSVRVVTVSQSRLPQTQAKPGRIGAAPMGLKPELTMAEATVAGGKVGDTANRAPSLPAPVAGLMDASPLGLKTGNPTKGKLPAPVIAAPAADAPLPQPDQAPIRDVKPSVSAVAAAQSKPLSKWLRKANPLAYLLGREPERRTVRTPVQTELSLERVKVVRNDLNETDLEVVPTRRTEKPVADTPRLQPLAPAEPASLSRLASRFLGAGQTQAR